MPATAEAPAADTLTDESADASVTPQVVTPAVPDVADLPTAGCVTVTEGAVKEIRRVIAEQAMPEDTVLRVGVSGGGCSGFSYALNFGDAVDEAKEEVFAQHGLVVAVPHKCGPHLDGTVIDFYAGVEKRGFTFENPNARNTCGCGSSFSA